MKKEICDKKMEFADCELAILRHAVDNAENKQGRQIISSPDIKKIITIVEKFIQTNKLLCYGGTAINNILPKQDQFYNKDIEIPDYDFYSPNALNDVKKLADIYLEEGFFEVEAKSGVHHGTYKVFVNFIAVADITQLPSELFNTLKKQSIVVAGIFYVPANFLRMSMYLELSRPSGDVSRWEKVLKRLTLLNKHHKLTSQSCDKIQYQRHMSNDKNAGQIFDVVKKSFIDQGVVFFGGYAISKYAEYFPHNIKSQLSKTPDFDVLSEEPTITAEIIKEQLMQIGIKNIKIIKRPNIGEIVAVNYEIIVDKDTIAFIYEPLACHSYNIIHEHGMSIKIATIDTMLSFYLAFLYSNRPYYDPNRILCMSKYLFDVQAKHRLSQKGLLKRFSINCFGHQPTLEEMRAEKAEKFKQFKNDINNPAYEEWFLRYRPSELVNNNTNTHSLSIKKIKKNPSKKNPSKKTKKKPSKKTLKHFFNLHL